MVAWRWMIVASCMAALVAAPPAGAAAPADCSGRYDLNQGGLLQPGYGIIPETLVVDGDAIEIEGWCRLEGVKRKTLPGNQTRLRARFRRCGALRRGRVDVVLVNCGGIRVTVKVKKARRKLSTDGYRYVPPSTFHSIEDRIFSDRGCAVSSCHGTSAAGNLDLRPGTAYASLVGVEPDNGAARAAGKLRVKGGAVAASFLSQKLHGTLGPDEGLAMPKGDDPLSAVEIALIDAWIAGGAPETGEVEGAPELPPRTYEETLPLLPPPGGFQVVLEGPTLEPGQEQEGCLWVAAPTPVDVPIRKVEIALNPGTHHFAVWEHDGPVPPPVGTWLAGDIACLNSGGNFGLQITGAPHAPYFLAEQPPGFASILPGGTYYGLNAHYYNESSGPIRMKVWVNFYPYEGTPEHLVKNLPLALDASGSIHVQPFTQSTARGSLVNTSSKTMRVLGLGGHMHKRGVRFTAWTSDGTKLFDDYDWAHPSFAAFSPTFDLAPGDHIDFECLHDNGVTRPVRRDYGGNPMTIVFGTSAEDEMCILTGQYYED